MQSCTTRSTAPCLGLHAKLRQLILDNSVRDLNRRDHTVHQANRTAEATHVAKVIAQSIYCLINVRIHPAGRRPYSQHHELLAFDSRLLSVS